MKFLAAKLPVGDQHFIRKLRCLLGYLLVNARMSIVLFFGLENKIPKTALLGDEDIDEV